MNMSEPAARIYGDPHEQGLRQRPVASSAWQAEEVRKGRSRPTTFVRQYSLTKQELLCGFMSIVMVVVSAVLLALIIVRHTETEQSEEAGPEARRAAEQDGVCPDDIFPEKDDGPFDVRDSLAVRNVLKGVNAQQLRKHLQYLTAVPHLSGTKESEQSVVNYIFEKLQEHGVDAYEKVPYTILHQYPVPEEPNQVLLMDKSGAVLLEAKLQEAEVPGVHTKAVPGYLAYSARGTVQGQLIFVNYGTQKDFDKLRANEVDVFNRICIGRLGGAHPGTMVRNCRERGGVGAILFPDPADVAPLGSEFVFPKSAYVGGTALQRYSLYAYGDPQTPGYPSVDEALRLEQPPDLPKIPAQVIGYDDAGELLRLLGGKEIFRRGGFGFPYKTGPFSEEHKGKVVRLAVNSEWKRKICYNVIGIIKGREQPDRYALTGNHHDAWAYGAVEPSSGTAALLELSRVLGGMRRAGWRPRRTIVLAFWAAHEMAVAGSQEWMEDRFLLLNKGAVGYANVGSCVSGPAFAATASPTLRNIVYSATKMVPHGKKSLYEIWFEYMFNKTAKKEPPVKLPRGGSDSAPFNFYAGIPSVDITFRPDKTHQGNRSYAAFHTAYDTLHLLEAHLDPDYSTTRRCAQLDGVLTLMLAESDVLPYDFVSLGRELQKGLDRVKEHQEQVTASKANIKWLKKEITHFGIAAKTWQTWLKRMDGKLHSTTRRVINDRMLLVERAFVKLPGYPGRPTIRNLAFSPRSRDPLTVVPFPTIEDSIQSVTLAKPGSTFENQSHDALRHNINEVTLAVRSARLLLNPDFVI